MSTTEIMAIKVNIAPTVGPEQRAGTAPAVAITQRRNSLLSFYVKLPASAQLSGAVSTGPK